MAEPFLGEIRLFPYSQVPTGDGWAPVQRAAAADQPEPGAVLAPGHDVRRQRADELRAARPARAGADPRGLRAHTGRARRRAGAHAEHRRAAAAHARAAGDVGDRGHAGGTREPAGRLPEPALRRAGDRADRARPDERDQRRWQPGAPEHAAVPDAELRDRAHRHLPVSPTDRGTHAMAQPFVGEIRMFAGNFAIAGLGVLRRPAHADHENEALFTLIGTTYGGDGESTFALPDLRGRVPIHQGNGFILAETGGAEEVTLTVNQIPAHTHPLIATTSSRTSHRRPTTCSPSRRRPTSTSRTPPPPRWPRRAIDAGRRKPAAHEPAALPRASTSSSRCSGSSRAFS